jgi:hypothetical protein
MGELRSNDDMMRPPRGWRPFLAACVAALVLSGCAAPGSGGSGGAIAAFATDGCSMFPDRAGEGGADWCSCCVAHDLVYWRGGTAEERHQADVMLQACVRQAANSALLANLMYAGVRIGGVPYLNTSFRWGYGWAWYRPYGALSPEETASADKEERDYRDTHPTLACPSAAAPSMAATPQ